MQYHFPAISRIKCDGGEESQSVLKASLYYCVWVGADSWILTSHCGFSISFLLLFVWLLSIVRNSFFFKSVFGGVGMYNDNTMHVMASSFILPAVCHHVIFLMGLFHVDSGYEEPQELNSATTIIHSCVCFHFISRTAEIKTMVLFMMPLWGLNWCRKGDVERHNTPERKHSKVAMIGWVFFMALFPNN